MDQLSRASEDQLELIMDLLVEVREINLQLNLKCKERNFISVTSETKVRSSTTKSSGHNTSSSIHSPSTPTTTTTYVVSEHVSETMMIPPRRKNFQRRKVVRRNSSLKARNATKRNKRQTRRTQLESCICS